MPLPLLAVALIVRDEQAVLARCLESVRGVADELIVYDTGSVDASMELALEGGATLIPGVWRDDFAWARNEVLAATTAEWVLSIDADEVAHVDVAALRELIGTTSVDAFAIEIVNLVGPDGRGLGRYPEPKLFRRSVGHWVGRVHERVERRDGQRLQIEPMPPQILRLVHSGYADPQIFDAKARRNARLCQIEMDLLLAREDGEPSALARIALDLGRSFMGCGQTTSAVAAFTLVRQLPENGEEWAWSLDFLARIALATGHPLSALEFTEELRASGRAPAYCAWLKAQALAELGHAAECYELLHDLGPIHDLAGRELDEGRVLELMALAAEHAGATPDPGLHALHAVVEAAI